MISFGCVNLTITISRFAQHSNDDDWTAAAVRDFSDGTHNGRDAAQISARNKNLLESYAPTMCARRKESDKR